MPNEQEMCSQSDSSGRVAMPNTTSTRQTRCRFSSVGSEMPELARLR